MSEGNNLAVRFWITIVNELVYSEGFQWWCLIFSIIYICSYLSFSRLYYPLIKNYGMNRIKINHNTTNINDNDTSESEITITKSKPETHNQTQTLLNNRYFKFQSLQASNKFAAWVNAGLTVSRGFNWMIIVNLQEIEVQYGFNYINDPFIHELIDMNMGYTFIDTIYMCIYDRKISQIPLFIHHLLLLLIGIALKSFGYGANVWVYAFAYADIATCILHFSWFARNIGTNLDNFYKISIKNNTNSLKKTIKFMTNLETFALLIFAIVFFYVRLWVLSRAFLVYMYQVWFYDVYGIPHKIFCNIAGAGLLGVGYMWSYKIILKFKRTIFGDKNKSKIRDNRDNKTKAE